MVAAYAGAVYAPYQRPQTTEQYKAAGWGNLTDVGGAWADLDDENRYIAAASWESRTPPNLIKSTLNQESSGNWPRDNRVAWIRGQRMLPFVGIFESTAKAWGYVFENLIGNRGEQIEAMGVGLSKLSRGYGGFENAATVYFGGPGALESVFVDEFGMRSDIYAGKVISNWRYLDEVGEGKTPVEPTPDGDEGGSSSNDGGGIVESITGFFARSAVFMLGVVLVGLGLWRVLT